MAINKKRKKSRIPRFKNYEEEAKWWDTHDTTEFEDEFKPVKLVFAKPLEHILGVRMDGKTLTQLTKLGDEMGIGPSTLVRIWIMEKLKTSFKQSGRSKDVEIPQAVLHKIAKPK